LGLHFSPVTRYLTDMLVVRADGFVDPCIPTLAAKPPAGPGWVHEVKHDGYRLIVRRDGETVRLFTRRGYDWTGRYPAIASAAAKISAQSFTLDGEAVVCGEDGVAIFDALHRPERSSKYSSEGGRHRHALTMRSWGWCDLVVWRIKLD
jgi:ATP-dependent DNA ligase